MVDDSDAKIAELDREADAARLTLERLDAAEPALLDRMKQLQSDARRELLDEMRVVYLTKADALDAAMASLLEVFDAHQEIVRQIDAAGFSDLARGFITPPPYLNGGIACTAQTLELWRQQRERLVDMQAYRPTPRPAAAAPKAKPAPQPEPRKATPSRAPRKCAEAPVFGQAKIVVLRPGLELGDGRCVTGDEVLVTNETAEKLMRSGAADVIERGQIGEAAQ